MDSIALPITLVESNARTRLWLGQREFENGREEANSYWVTKTECPYDRHNDTCCRLGRGSARQVAGTEAMDRARQMAQAIPPVKAILAHVIGAIEASEIVYHDDFLDFEF